MLRNMWLILLLPFAVLLGIYIYFSNSYNYWKKRGVPNPPISILFGNLKDAVLVRKSFGEIYNSIYNNYPDLPYVGLYKIQSPVILIRDVKLLQRILISEFSSFTDNDFYADEKNDPLFAKSPFTLKGEKWKTVRNQILPTFSTEKIRLVFPLIDEVGNALIKYLRESNDATGKFGIETKELAAKFTTDVVASCVFGTDGKSFTDPKPEFREVGKKYLTPSLTFALKQMVYLIFPAMAYFVNAKFYPDDVADYFRKTVQKTLKYREENNIVRGDFLDIMNDFKLKLGEKEFDNEDITAHCAAFFTDGFETSSFALSYSLFELATNLNIQKSLREKLEEVLRRDGKFLYDNIQEINYLDNILKEVLRKHPPVPFLSRVCTKPFELPSLSKEGNGPNVLIEPGTPVIISTFGIHYDSKYYSDPHAFQPERHSEENKGNITKCTFIPFGDGPRGCVGQRFGMIQVKVALAYIITNFEVRFNEKTKLPFVYDPYNFLLKVKDNIWLNFYKIN